MIMEKTTNVGGTYLQGYIKATYEQLLKAFGEPHDPDGDNYKTDVEWAFKFADGTVATSDLLVFLSSFGEECF